MMKYLITSISSYHIIQLAGENKEYWKVKKTKQNKKQNPLHSFIFVFICNFYHSLEKVKVFEHSFAIDKLLGDDASHSQHSQATVL